MLDGNRCLIGLNICHIGNIRICKVFLELGCESTWSWCLIYGGSLLAFSIYQVLHISSINFGNLHFVRKSFPLSFQIFYHDILVFIYLYLIVIVLPSLFHFCSLSSSPRFVEHLSLILVFSKIPPFKFTFHHPYLFSI